MRVVQRVEKRRRIRRATKHACSTQSRFYQSSFYGDISIQGMRFAMSASSVYSTLCTRCVCICVYMPLYVSSVYMCAAFLAAFRYIHTFLCTKFCKHKNVNLFQPYGEQTLFPLFSTQLQHIQRSIFHVSHHQHHFHHKHIAVQLFVHIKMNAIIRALMPNQQLEEQCTRKHKHILYIQYIHFIYMVYMVYMCIYIYLHHEYTYRRSSLLISF